MICKTVFGLVGVTLGAIAGGAGGILITLVFPHGGWEQVSSDERLQLQTWTILGGAMGFGIGAMFDIGLRKTSKSHLVAGVLLGAGAFWGFASAFALSDRAPFWWNSLSAIPYLLFAGGVLSQKSTGRQLWLALSPTLVFSIWLNFYAYPFWLHDSVRSITLQMRLSEDERRHAGIIESSSVWVVLLWPCLGIMVALVSTVLWKLSQRRLNQSSRIPGDQRTAT